MFIQTMTSKLLSLFSCKKVKEVLAHFINIHYTPTYSVSVTAMSFYLFIRREQVLMQLCNSLCWHCFSTANLLKNWRSGIARKKTESFAVRQLSSLPSLKSQSQTSYWEISEWKKRLWSGVKAFSFDLCWNAKYVSVWTFVLTRWRSKQRWACWKRTLNTHTQSFLEKPRVFYTSFCMHCHKTPYITDVCDYREKRYIKNKAGFCFKVCVTWRNCLNSNNKQKRFSHELTFSTVLETVAEFKTKGERVGQGIRGMERILSIPQDKR